MLLTWCTFYYFFFFFSLFFFFFFFLFTGQLQGYEGDPSLLGKVDALLLELTKMTHFKEHMECLSIKNQFQEQADVSNYFVSFFFFLLFSC